MQEFTIYEGQLNSHQKPHGLGKMRWKTNGDTYEGTFKNGFPHGIGTMKYSTMQYTYTGDFSHGKRHGIGYLLLSSSELICGQFIENNIEGYCIQYHSNGDYYEGIMKSNEKNGEGIMRYNNGDVYYGSWFRNQRHGIGRLILSDGVQSYQGTWQYDKFTGRGKVTQYLENSGILTVFEGQFIDGKLNGEGVFTDSVGIYYKGEFLNGQMHGAGELLLPNGGRYVGQFLYNSFRRGKGEKADRTVAYGNFYNMAPDGIKVKMQYNNGEEYEGGMREGNRSGFGSYTTKKGVKTLGKYDENVITGGARISFPDGSEYYSTFDHGKETGITVYKSPKRRLIN